MKNDAKRYRRMDLGPMFVFNYMLVTLRIEAGDHNFSNLGDTLVYC